MGRELPRLSVCPFAREHERRPGLLLRARSRRVSHLPRSPSAESLSRHRFVRISASNPRFFAPAPGPSRPGANQGSRPLSPTAVLTPPNRRPPDPPDPRRCMIHGGAEDSTDIENSNSDAERGTPTPSSTRRDDASADRGSSPDKARGSDATTAAVEERPELRPARHSIDQIVAQLDPHAPRALEPDRTIDETTTRGDMSAAVANGVGTHKVQVQVQDESENSSDSRRRQADRRPEGDGGEVQGHDRRLRGLRQGFRQAASSPATTSPPTRQPRRG